MDINNINININIFNFNISNKTKAKPVEKIYIPVNGQSDGHEITTSPMPSKGGYLRRCITFVKDWNWIVPAIRFVIENCQTVVLIVWSLFG